MRAAAAAAGAAAAEEGDGLDIVYSQKNWLLFYYVGL
jgi:hypothetical protein